MANVSKERRERYLEDISEIRRVIDGSGLDPEGRLLPTLANVEKEVLHKKYGLVWEEHTERVDELAAKSVPTLREDRDLFVQRGGETNFLIEGDNLEALRMLQSTHRGRIQLCYVDPPYNTQSNDFRYDDRYVGKDDGFKHSKWLSFMEKRLRLAKSLLSPDGAIFISIDDREQAPLKMLCDEVFGADCFIGNICWQKTYSPRNDAKGLPTEAEYILAYSRHSSWEPGRLERTAEMDVRYSSPDGDPVPWKAGDASAPGAATHHGMVYAIQHPITKVLLYPPNGRCWALGQDQMLAIMNEWAPYTLKDIGDADKRATLCGCSTEDMQAVSALLLESEETGVEIAKRRYESGAWPLLYFTSGGRGGLSKKVHLDKVEGKLPTNLWPYGEVGHTDGATKELKAIFGGVSPFETPKPTQLIQRVIQIASSPDATVLDFFAGSATTGHAVLKQNKVDGGSRKFILCTDNQNGICREVAYERLRRVMEGYPFTGKVSTEYFSKKLTMTDLRRMSERLDAAESIRAEHEHEHDSVKVKYKDGVLSVVAEDRIEQVAPGTGGTLKYLRLERVGIEDRLYFDYADELLDGVRELVELENSIDFESSEGRFAICLTDDEVDAFSSDAEAVERCEKLYIGHDVLATETQRALFDQHEIDVNIIPEYYYPNGVR